MSARSQGFTLVELMITVTIFVILVTVGVPSMKNTYEQIRASSANSELQQALAFARSTAVSYGTTVTVCPNNNGACGNNWIDGFLIYLRKPNNEMVILKEHSGFNSDDYLVYDKDSVSFSSTGLITGNFDTGVFKYCPGSRTSASSVATELSRSGKVRRSDAVVTCPAAGSE
ncbi:GspH/FimT family pseudopilin [Shewanella sp. GXUN23E]|uniref:GspH/FimT family pseudopilin n=1 Tax=Shewanella sp. GXUN23E TaxID=3422498 RepID=UPI003D7E2B23